MELVSAGLTIVILGSLYWRMIKRETPERIGAFHALVPIALGVVSMFIGAFATVLLAKSLGGMANIMAGNRGFSGSMLRSFLMAGVTEETAKLLLILLGLMIYEIVVLILFRKNTEKFCGMRISAAEPAA